jgi:Rrf2 family transcriptional regulator, cysteine metabolism repressor
VKLSTKGRYAVRIMLCVARNQHYGPVCKKLIAQEEGISKDYIEQIAVPLKNAGLLTGHRGMKGGFTLGQHPEKINLLDILQASEGKIELVGCNPKTCRAAITCVTRPVWEEASRKLETHFSSITLQELLNRHQQNTEREPMYSI